MLLLLVLSSSIKNADNVADFFNHRQPADDRERRVEVLLGSLMQQDHDGRRAADHLLLRHRRDAHPLVGKSLRDAS